MTYPAAIQGTNMEFLPRVSSKCISTISLRLESYNFVGVHLDRHNGVTKGGDDSENKKPLHTALANLGLVRLPPKIGDNCFKRYLQVFCGCDMFKFA